jgi:hypothetical protein
MSAPSGADYVRVIFLLPQRNFMVVALKEKNQTVH